MHPTLKTHIGGELVELPGTIAAIRQLLPDDLVDEFDREVESTAGDQLTSILARWALLGTGAEEEDEEMFRRLEAGDHTGCVPADDEAAPGAA